MAADAEHRPTRLHVVTVGDVLLDVVVVASTPLVADDDVPARIRLEPGGQAANVAAWAAWLGVSATVIGPASTSAAGQLVSEHLGRVGVRRVGVAVPDVGMVVSVVAGGSRTLASDPGDLDWPQRLDADLMPDTADWLHFSAYPLLRAGDPSALLGLVERGRARGAKLSVDLSSATLIGEYGDQAARQVLLGAVRPELVFGTRAEWEALGLDIEAVPFVAVRKDGAAGVDVIKKHAAGTGRPGADPVAGGARWGGDQVDADRIAHYPAPQVEVVDATGAGDAFAAGYLVGGIATALEAAARCLTRPGAFPR